MVSPFVFDLASYVIHCIRGFGLECEYLACEDLDEHSWYRGLNEFSVCYRCCRRFGSKESTSSIIDWFWKLAVPPATPRPEYKLGFSRINFPSHRRSTIITMPSSTSVLPAPYFYFFWLLEPILTVAGGVSAIYDPISFGGNTLPRNIERATLKMGNTVRGQIVVSELGSCKSCSKLPLSHLFLTCVWVVVRVSGFMLLAMISFSLFYLFKKHLEDKPVLQEKLVKGLLIPLAIADVSSYIIYC